MTSLDHTPPLSAERREEIRERVRKALEGPYEPQWDSCDCGPDDGCKNGHRWIHALRLPVPKTVNHHGEPAAWEFLYSELGEIPADTVLMFAHARKDIEALLAEVDRLSAALADLLGQNAMTESNFDDFAEAALRQEEKLTTQIEAAKLVVSRLTSERDQARETAKHTAGAMVKVGEGLTLALRQANIYGADAGMAVVRDLMADMPQARPDGGEVQ